MEHLLKQNAAALFLDPGLGKTSIVLQAFCELKAAGQAKRMLVVAPRRVCQLVWRQEAQKWTQFRDLTITFLHGPNKDKLLREGLEGSIDMFLINPEGVAWLASRYFGRSIPFDIVVLDELTKFKNSQAERHKKFRPRLSHVRRRWGLTGTPSPNGYMDLFGQFLMLDDGAALGRYITHYRDTYFQPDFNGYDYTLQPRGAERIQERIAPYVLCMKAEDYIKLPALVDDVREIELGREARSLYETMRKQMIVTLHEGNVEAANSAAVYSKLKQMANGAVYVEAQESTAAVLHDEKLDALEELVEELNGAPLLVAYEFNHDLARLKERFKGDDVAYMADASEAEAVEIVRRWNAGQLRLLFAHPASAGHGLNLQGGGAAHVCWFSPIWDFEIYDQFIRRVRRQGNDAACVVNHILLVRHTIDELALQALRDKDTTQSRLLGALKAALFDDGRAAPYAANEPKENNMTIVKLSRQSVTAPATPTPVAETVAPKLPKGWGVKKDVEPAHVSDETAQRVAIQAKLRGDATEMPIVESAAKSAFSPAVQAVLAEPSEPELPFAAPEPKAAAPSMQNSNDIGSDDTGSDDIGSDDTGSDDTGSEGSPLVSLDQMRTRQWALKLAFARCEATQASFEEIVAAAQKLYDFVVAK